ncbi:hypothetical protein SSTU70S_00112 [Stutzerimonas stutzeri]
MYGRSWQLKVASTPEYEAVLRHSNRTFDLVSPLLAAALFSRLIGGYLYLRERALRASQRLSVQAQEREARFRQLIEQLPVATLLCNAAGRIELADQSAASLLGSNAGLLAGERVSRYLPFLLGGDSLAQRSGLHQQETQALREDANPVPVALSLTSFNHDEARYYVLNLLDLQARKRDEERFRNVVEASPNAFVLVDSEGRIVMVNRQTSCCSAMSASSCSASRSNCCCRKRRAKPTAAFARSTPRTPNRGGWAATASCSAAIATAARCRWRSACRRCAAATSSWCRR